MTSSRTRVLSVSGAVPWPVRTFIRKSSSVIAVPFTFASTLAGGGAFADVSFFSVQPETMKMANVTIISSVLKRVILLLFHLQIDFIRQCGDGCGWYI